MPPSSPHAFDVFISHMSPDAPVAREIAEALRAEGLRVWFSEWELRAGDSIDARVREGLDGSRTMVLLLSEHSTGPEWSVIERQADAFRDPTHRDRRFVPVRLDDSPVGGVMRTSLSLDMRHDRSRTIDQLVALCRDLDPSPGPAHHGPRPAVTSLGIGGRVTVLALCADATRLVCGASNGAVRVLDAATGSVVATLSDHEEEITAVALGPDGTTAITAADDGIVHLWDVVTGSIVRSIVLPQDWVRSATFSPDGARALVGCETGGIHEWNLSTGEATPLVDPHSGAVVALAYGPDGSHVLTASDRDGVRHRALRSGTTAVPLDGPPVGAAGAVVVTADGREGLAASLDGSIHRWDLTTGSRSVTYETRDVVTAAAFAPDGTSMLFAGARGAIRRWDLGTHLITSVDPAPGPVAKIVYDPRLAYAFSVGGAGTVFASLDVHGLAPDAELPSFAGHLAEVNAVDYSPDGRRALSGADDGTVRLWDLETGTCSAVLTGHEGLVTSVAFDPHSTRALSGDAGGRLILWDLATGDLLLELVDHTDWVRSIAFNPDGVHALTGSDDATVRHWDLTTGQAEDLEGHTNWVLSVAYSSDGTRALSGGTDGTARIWDLGTGRTTQLADGSRSWINSAVFAPTGPHVLTGSNDGTVRLWDLRTGSEALVLEGHTGRVSEVAFDADGHRAASAATDGTVRIWDLGTGATTVVLDAPPAAASVRWITDTEVAALTDHGTILRWDLRSAVDRPPVTSDRHLYTNAKVVLVGDSQAGKSGLAQRLAHGTWTHSESTVGAWASQLVVSVGDPGDDTIDREIWIWDFGGQADQRLVHQLYLRDAAAAVLVFDGQLVEVPQLWEWTRAVQAASPAAQRVLAAGRIDVNPVRLGAGQIDQFREAAGFVRFVPTSARTGEGCDDLREAIIDAIDWDAVPHRSSPLVFQRLRAAILELRDGGRTLTSVKELRDLLPASVGAFEPEQLDAVVGLLAGPGAVLPLGFGDYVLLRPGLLNAYAQAVIRTLRDDPEERGAIAQERVLTGDLDYPPDFERLSEADERTVLHAMHKQLIEGAMCLRLVDAAAKRPTMLVFPAYFRRERPPGETQAPRYLTFSFSGNVEEIYTSLVVRLHHGDPFDNTALWQDAADFAATTGTVSIHLTRRSDGTGVIDLHCDGATTTDQVLLGRYTREHLERHGQDVTELRTYVCRECGTPVENRDVAKRRLLEGKDDIGCVLCESRIPLWDDIARALESEEVRLQVEAMRDQAQRAIDTESRERLLVGEVIALTARADQIPREIQVSDHGIDMEIEFKDDLGQATGRRVYLQLKSGDSHLRHRKRDDSRVFPIRKQRHATYWAGQEWPVILVIRNADESIEWMEVRTPLRAIRDGGGPWPARQIVFEGRPLDVTAIRGWRDQALAVPTS